MLIELRTLFCTFFDQSHVRTDFEIHQPVINDSIFKKYFKFGIMVGNIVWDRVYSSRTGTRLHQRFQKEKEKRKFKSLEYDILRVSRVRTSELSNQSFTFSIFIISSHVRYWPLNSNNYLVPAVLPSVK